VPPAAVSVHVWADQLTALDLGWTIGREARDAEPALSIDAATTLAPGSDLLSLVRAELPELARAVGVRRVLPLTLDPERREQPTLALSDGSVLVASAVPGGVDRRAGRGLVVVLTASLDLAWTDLPAKPLVVPLIQEVVRQGVGLARGSWHTPAGTRPALPIGTTELRAAASLLSDEQPQGPATIATGEDPSSTPPLRRAGIYRATDAQGTTRAWISIAPDSRASDTTPVAAPVARAWINSIAPGATIQEINDPGAGSEPATLASALGSSQSTSDRAFAFLIAALALALIELALARWSSHARALGTGDADVSPSRTGAAGVAA
jgi:hypothetical protein